jgi:hypothetical protein
MTLLIRRLPVLLSPLLLGLGPISVSHADFTDPKLMLHMVQGSGLPSDCSAAPLNLACNNWGSPNGSQILAQTQGDQNTDYHVYVLLADVDSASGLKEIQFGLTFESGVTVSAWRSCADEVVPGEGWPAANTEITLRFTANGGCVRPTPDPNDLEHRGIIPLLVLSVRSSSNALLRLIPTTQGSIPLTNCSSVTTPLNLDFGLGEIGFGYKIGWDPCNFNPFAHGCAEFFPCTCCLGPSCSPIAPYYDIRSCINDGGEVLFIGTNDCSECAVPTKPLTWSEIKSRYQ